MEFHTVKNADGRLVLTPKRWVKFTNAKKNKCLESAKPSLDCALSGGVA
jgi:hypothetical protein